MGRYPAEPLEDKLVWMRERQRKREQLAAREALTPGRAVPPDLPLLPQMLRVPQVAKALGVSMPTVRRWFRKRAVVVRGPTKHRSVMLIPRRALDEWICEHDTRAR